MACRIDVRESKAKRLAEITNNNVAANLSMFLGRKEKATGSWKIADPLSWITAGNPHWHPTI